MADQHTENIEAQLEFMRSRLETARHDLKDEPLALRYIDSRGNERVKANPAFDAYHTMLRSYIHALREYREQVGKQPAKQPQLVKFEQFAATMRKAIDG